MSDIRIIVAEKIKQAVIEAYEARDLAQLPALRAIDKEIGRLKSDPENKAFEFDMPESVSKNC